MNPEQKRKQVIHNLIKYHRQELSDADYEEQVRKIMMITGYSRQTAKSLRISIEPWLLKDTDTPRLITAHDDNIERYFAEQRE